MVTTLKPRRFSRVSERAAKRYSSDLSDGRLFDLYCRHPGYVGDESVKSMNGKSLMLFSTRSTMGVSGVTCLKTCRLGKRSTMTSVGGSAKASGNRFMTSYAEKYGYQLVNNRTPVRAASIVNPSRRGKKGGGPTVSMVARRLKDVNVTSL